MGAGAVNLAAPDPKNGRRETIIIAKPRMYAINYVVMNRTYYLMGVDVIVRVMYCMMS